MSNVYVMMPSGNSCKTIPNALGALFLQAFRQDSPVSGVADPFNGHIDEFRIAHIQRSDRWIAVT